MSTRFTYEDTTVLYFYLHVIPRPGIDHLIELRARTWTDLSHEGIAGVTT